MRSWSGKSGRQLVSRIFSLGTIPGFVEADFINSLKHSGEDRVQVQLQGDPSGIELEVRDRGVGFDVANVKNTGGLGLVSMRERIELLNGTIPVDSKPNAGTRWVPLDSDSNVRLTPGN